MNVDKTSVTQTKGRQAAAQFGLNGPDTDIDRENVLDLLAVLEDDRRFHAAAALLTEDPVECERYRVLAHDAAALLANIRHGLAHVAQQHLSRGKRTRQLERYVERLIDGSQMSAGYHEWSTVDTQGDSP